MRRTIELILALALSVGGGVWLAFQLLSAGRIFYMLILAAYLMIGVGGAWLGALHYSSLRKKDVRQGRDHLKAQIEAITRQLSSVRRKTTSPYPKASATSLPA
jgi:hypothetical protein